MLLTVTKIIDYALNKVYEKWAEKQTLTPLSDKKNVCFVVYQKGRGASEYTSWPFALTGHMVQSPPYSEWQKSVASSTGTSKTKESQA